MLRRNTGVPPYKQCFVRNLVRLRAVRTPLAVRAAVSSGLARRCFALLRARPSSTQYAVCRTQYAVRETEYVII